MNEKELLDYLNTNEFTYQRLEHPAVFTCEEADAYHSDVEAVHTKNLFLCDKKGRRFFLAVTACEKTVNLSELAVTFGVSHLRFASEENLIRLLGVTRGSVTMMGLVNDSEHQVNYGWMERSGMRSFFYLIRWLILPPLFWQDQICSGSSKRPGIFQNFFEFFTVPSVGTFFTKSLQTL